ncbi:MAG: GAF domain-containing protein, partial [Leptospiraceae bacterium]|nr:GAF domain-containing protein [Leptospiraceae bacterium]
SLDLIQDLLEYRDYSLSILGTYREEEVNELHPLSRALESYQLAGIASEIIHLKPLGPRDLKLMLLDTFRIGAEDSDAEKVANLAELLYKKSEGNPFVARQYLESLFEKQLIHQDRNTGIWSFDLARIRTDGLSSSAAEVLAARIASVPDCQDVLAAAACLGNRFSLASLAALAGQDILFTLQQLQTISSADIIYPLSESYKYISTESSREDMEVVEFGFSHDRIHEAVLAQIPPARLEQLNLDAARLLLERSDYQQIQERIASIVSHYNQGRNLVWDDDEKLKIAELNLRAGLKERRSSAVDEAIVHFGISLDTLHQRQAPIPVDLHMELLRNMGEAEYLRGRKIVAQDYFDKVLKGSRDLLEKLKVFDFKIALLASAGQHSDAVGVGLQALKSAGFKIRSHSKAQEKKVLQSWARPALKFIDLHRKRKKRKEPAPEKKALARILAQTITPAFLLDSNYLASLLDTLFELSRKHGPFPETSVAMVLLGALLGPNEHGMRIGDQALDLAERYNAVELRGRLHYYYLSTIHSWNQPWETGIPRYRRAADYCLEAGDLPFASLSLFEFLSRQMLLCRRLPDLEIIARYEQEIVRTGQDDSVELYWLLRQVAQNFQSGGKAKTRLQGDYFDEQKHAKGWKGRRLFYLSLYKHWLAYIFFPDAGNLPEFVQSENWPRAHIDTILYEYLRAALPYMTGTHKASPNAGDELIARISELDTRNFSFMKYHLQAEKKWHLGQVQEAMTAFDLACDAPQQPLTAGIIHERTAHFYLWMQKPRFARIYAERARTIYTEMQSHTQVQQAERLLDEIRMMEYRQRPNTYAPQMGETPGLNEASFGSGRGPAGSQLDLEAIMQMANIVSSRLELDELIRSLLRSIMENAGARKAVLLEKSSEGYVLRGMQNPDQEPELNSLRKPDPSLDLALSVAHYAESMQEPVVLDNARESESFSGDPYIENGKIASILCIPLILKGEVTNLLYLEHSTSRSAFSPERVRILGLLGSQIATSLENARLYENVRNALVQEQRARQSEARINTIIRRFVPDEFLNILGVTDFVDVKLGQNIEREMTVLFSDIRSFTSLSESMSPEENFRFINSYLSRIGPLVRESGGFIDKYIGDAVMALFEKPDQAIRAARAMMLELDAYNSGRIKGGYEPIRIGVGVHTGVLRLGIIGEEGRIEGTVIGDTVNLASRLEGLNRSYGSSVIASDSTVEYLKGSTLFSFRALDRVRVKGKQRDTWIYELLLHPPDSAWLKNYAKALLAYQEARFSESREHFLKLKQEKPDDSVIDLYLRRLESLLENPVPEDWEGIENLTKK